MQPTPYSVVLSGGVQNTRVTASDEEASLENLYRQCSKPQELEFKAVEYYNSTKKQRADIKKQLRYFVGATIAGKRHDSNVQLRTLLTLDIEQDDIAGDQPPPPQAVVKKLQEIGGSGWVYTSISHTPDRPRYRVVLPLGKYIPQGTEATATLKATTLKAAASLGIETWCRPESWVLSQPMYLPARLQGGPFYQKLVKGKAWAPTALTKHKPNQPADIPDERPDPVLSALKQAGMYLGHSKEKGRHLIRCPYHEQHGTDHGADEHDTQTMYMEANFNGFSHPSVQCFDTAPDDGDDKHLTYDKLVRWLKDNSFISTEEQAKAGVLDDVDEFIQAASAGYTLDAEPAEREWAIQDFAPVGLVTMLTGPGGQGKSLMLMQLAIHAAIGQSWAAFKIDKPIKTLVLSYEDDQLELHRRSYVLIKRLADSETGILYDVDSLYRKNFLLYAAGNDLSGAWTLLTKMDRVTTQHTPRVEWLITVLKKARIRLLTIDPAVFTHAVEENSNTDIASYMRMLTYIAREAQCAVVIVHHAGKSTMGANLEDLDQTAARGAGAFADNARSVSLCVSIHPRELANYGLPAMGRYMLVKHVKHNYSAPLPEMILERKTSGTTAWLEHRPEVGRLDERALLELKQAQKQQTEETRLAEHTSKVFSFLYEHTGEVSIAQIQQGCGLSHARYAKAAVEYLEQQDYVETGRDGNRITVLLLEAGRRHWKFALKEAKK